MFKCYMEKDKINKYILNESMNKLKGKINFKNNVIQR